MADTKMKPRKSKAADKAKEQMKDALVVTTKMIVMLPLKRICKYCINNYITDRNMQTT